MKFDLADILDIDMCVEKWTITHGRMHAHLNLHIILKHLIFCVSVCRLNHRINYIVENNVNVIRTFLQINVRCQIHFVSQMALNHNGLLCNNFCFPLDAFFSFWALTHLHSHLSRCIDKVIISCDFFLFRLINLYRCREILFWMVYRQFYRHIE